MSPFARATLLLSIALNASACASTGDPSKVASERTETGEYADVPVCFELKGEPGSPRPPSIVRVVEVAQRISPPVSWPPWWEEKEELANVSVEFPDFLGLQRQDRLWVVSRDLEERRAFWVSFSCGRRTASRRSNRGLVAGSPARGRVWLAETRGAECSGGFTEYRLGDDGAFQWGGQRSSRIWANRVECRDS